MLFKFVDWRFVKLAPFKPWAVWETRLLKTEEPFWKVLESAVPWAANPAKVAKALDSVWPANVRADVVAKTLVIVAP